MAIGFGMASSHAPSLFAYTYEGWERTWARFRGDAPEPPEAAAEDRAQIEAWIRRTAVAFAELKSRLTAFAPDAVIVLAGDQNEWFDASHLPNIMVYAGHDDVAGYHNFGADDVEPRLLPWEHPERFAVRLRVDSELAEFVVRGLVDEGFDAGVSRKLPAFEGRRKAPHALVRPLPLILPNMDVPIVPIMMKTVERSPAITTGERCLELGRSLERICRGSAKRIALYGSGGMSHDPSGPRAGWVDEPLDRWVLEMIESGRPDKLKPLFSFQSAALESGTGELRTWLPVAAAMDSAAPGIGARIVEYFAARKSTSGCGWAIWEGVNS